MSLDDMTSKRNGALAGKRCFEKFVSWKVFVPTSQLGGKTHTSCPRTGEIGRTSGRGEGLCEHKA